MSTEAQCPVMHGAGVGGTQNEDWWPNQLNLRVLDQNPPSGNPMGEEFDYSKAFATLNLDEVKADLTKVRQCRQNSETLSAQGFLGGSMI